VDNTLNGFKTIVKDGKYNLQKNEYMRDKQVASEYPVSRPTLWRWAKMGKIVKRSAEVVSF